MTSSGRFSVRLTLGGERFRSRGILTPSASDRGEGFAANVETPAAVSTNGGGSELRLSFTFNSATALTGTLTLDNAPYSTISAEQAIYTGERRPKPPLINPPFGLIAKYTMLLPALSPATRGNPRAPSRRATAPLPAT